MTGRETRSELDHVAAECLGCPWTNTARNAQATAARHHDATGHPVTVTKHTTIVYGDPLGSHPTLFPDPDA